MKLRKIEAFGIDESSLKEKTRILIMSDDPRLNTGFGKVCKNLAESFIKDEKFSVHVVGWFSPTHIETRSSKEVNDGLRVANNTDINIIESNLSETYGIKTFEKVVSYIKPHIVITVGDLWMVEEVPSVKSKYNFFWYGYTPIDGERVPNSFKKTLDSMDKIVTYGSFGKTQLLKSFPDLDGKIISINHGVDTNIYKVMSKVSARKLLGLKSDDFIILWNARNTPRKRIDIALSAFKKFIGMSSRCKKCNEMYFYLKEDNCDTCNTNEYYRFFGKGIECKLFLFTTSVDIGFDIQGLVNSYNLKDNVLIPDGLHVGVGIEEEEMAIIYSASDVFLNTSEAEGWGMPIHEAMACGIPVVAPKFGGYTEDLATEENCFLYKVGNLKYDYTGYLRPNIIDDNIVESLDVVYYLGYLKNSKLYYEKWLKEIEPISLERKITESTKRATELSWDLFKEKWNNCIKFTFPDYGIDTVIERINLYKLNKILLVVENFDYIGGAEKSIKSVIDYLVLKFKDTLFIIYQTNNSDGSQSRSLSYSFNKIVKITGPAFNYKVLTKFIQDTKPSLVLTQLRITSVVSDICLKNNIPYHVFMRSYEGICEDNLRMATCSLNCNSCSTYLDALNTDLRRDYSFALNRADLIIYNSFYFKDLIEKSLSKYNDKLINEKNIVLYPYVDVKNGDHISKINTPDSEKFIAMIKPTEAKGSFIFYNIAMRMPSYRFIMIGKPELQTYELIKNYPLNNLSVIDVISNQSEMYSLIRLLLVPSIWPEPFGRIVLEAMSNGIDVISSESGGLKESGFNHSIYISNVYDIDEWVGAVLNVLDNGVIEYRNNGPSLLNNYTEVVNEMFDLYYRKVKAVISDAVGIHKTSI